MADRFEDLRTLLTVISSGGVNAAAAELGIAKSAVSRRLSDLEKRLGVSLIERSQRRFELTAIGQEYATRARSVLSSLDDLDSSVVPRDERQVIALRAPTAILNHVIAPALATARLAFGTEPPILRLLSDEVDVDGSFDVLVSGEVPEGLSGRPLVSTTEFFCASPAYLAENGSPSEPRDLDRHAAIVVGEGASQWRTGGRIRPVSNVALVSPDIDVAAAAAVAGLGVAQLPDFVLATALADGRLTRLLEGHEPEASQLKALHRDDAGAEVRRLVDALASACSVGQRARLRGHSEGDQGN